MGIGSLAAAWQASMGGYIAAGSAFAILQSIGVTCAIGIPLLGVGGLGLTLFGPSVASMLLEHCSMAAVGNQIKELVKKVKEWVGYGG
jgi:hypothetical protein